MTSHFRSSAKLRLSRSFLRGPLPVAKAGRRGFVESQTKLTGYLTVAAAQSTPQVETGNFQDGKALLGPSQEFR